MDRSCQRFREEGCFSVAARYPLGEKQPSSRNLDARLFNRGIRCQDRGPGQANHFHQADFGPRLKMVGLPGAGSRGHSRHSVENKKNGPPGEPARSARKDQNS